MGSTPSKTKTSNDGNVSDEENGGNSRRLSGSSETGEGVFQAGGHGKLKKDPNMEGAIRKVAQEAEILFYQTLNSEDPRMQEIPLEIRSFFPKFYGVQDKKFIMLEDLTAGAKKACVMDIKMGTKTYTSDSNVIKQLFLESKDSRTTTQALGFRITGFRVYSKKTKEFDVKTKPWGMALRPADVPENLKIFFDDGEQVRGDVLQKFIDRLEILLPWYSTQNIIKIYSSSLLFVYDSDGTADNANVHMIDFAHVKRIEDPDDRDHRYVAGLKNLLDILKQIRDTYAPVEIETPKKKRNRAGSKREKTPRTKETKETKEVSNDEAVTEEEVEQTKSSKTPRTLNTKEKDGSSSTNSKTPREEEVEQTKSSKTPRSLNTKEKDGSSSTKSKTPRGERVSE